jgi:hypothetical protein
VKWRQWSPNACEVRAQLPVRRPPSTEGSQGKIAHVGLRESWTGDERSRPTAGKRAQFRTCRIEGRQSTATGDCVKVSTAGKRGRSGHDRGRRVTPASVVSRRQRGKGTERGGEATVRAGRRSVRASTSQRTRGQDASVLQVGGREEPACSP